MSDEPGARGSAPAVGVRGRRVLTGFLLVHWFAVAAYVLPATRDALDPLPDWIEPAATLVIPRAVRWVSPLTVPYLDLTATRQTWTLFAPYPAEWVASVRVVPYFARDGVQRAWVADTLVVRGAEEVPYPHLLRHRTYRILWNLGYDAWGDAYRPLFAREMCQTLRNLDGDRPDGVVLLDHWTRILVPWRGETPATYEQSLGGFDCRAFRGQPRAPWPGYGLTLPLDTRSWPLVDAPEAITADSAGASELRP